MPVYRFAVHNRQRITSDATEVLCDDRAALEEASGIIRDLKKNRAADGWDGWTIEVLEGDRRVCDISFVGRPP
jgi:hypothetical protein